MSCARRSSRQLEGFEARRATGLFRLPVDRAFVIKGHGTVVTGTAMGAEVRLGQKSARPAGGAEVRVRSIQVHGESVESAGLCQRVALNLSGAEKIELQRGDVLADERLDIHDLAHRCVAGNSARRKAPAQEQHAVRFFIGTAETIGRVIVLRRSGAIAPKARGLVQLVLERPVVALSGDRFVVRDETNLRTLGGGVVLNPLGRRVRKPIDAYRASDALVETSGADAIEALLNLQESFALSAPRHRDTDEYPDRRGRQPRSRIRALSSSRWATKKASPPQPNGTELKAFALASARDASSRPSRSRRVSRWKRCARGLPYEIGARAFRALIDRLAHETDIVREESIAAPQISSGAARWRRRQAGRGSRAAALTKAEFQPPDLKQLAEALKLPSSELPASAPCSLRWNARAASSRWRPTSTSRAAARSRASTQLIDHSGNASAKSPRRSYRDVLGASRKFAIALLDYFDHAGVTTRVGDARKPPQFLTVAFLVQSPTSADLQHRDARR